MAETLLKIENLTKEYEGQKILDGINLEVKQGDVLVVVGPSGCGKSTLLRCINALEPIQGGTIKLQGMDIRKGSKNITTLRQKIGMVFQSYELFPHLTVLDNITLAPVKVQKRDKAEAQKEAMELLARVENILRRARKERTRFVFDALTVDLPSRRVTKDGREVALTALEFDLLAMLVRRNNVALSREALLAGVWGYAYQGETRTVDVHIQRLRGKIGAEYIETVYKYGYRFCGKEVERR